MRIYLDNNATTRPLPEVVERMTTYSTEAYANPGSQHADGRKARQVLEESRETIARVLDADPEDVVFTSGGTESTNLVLLGLTDGTPRTIAVTAGEHPATMEVCRFREQQGWNVVTLTVDGDGRLDPSQYDDLPWNDLHVVSVILAHNETGVIQDLESLAERCRDANVAFHVDAVQAAGKIPVSFRQLGASSLAIGAHKFHGPRGIGALLVRPNLKLSPTAFGGHQELGRRPGTEPVALIAGMAVALADWFEQSDEQMTYVRRLRDRLESGLQESCSPILINGSTEHRLPNTSNVGFPGLDGEALLVNLDLNGVACSLGSTCASGSSEPAPALLAMNRPEEVLHSSVRFSVSRFNTIEQIDEAVQRITSVVNNLRAAQPSISE